MPRRTLTILLAASCGAVSVSQAQRTGVTVISGTLVGADGAPLPVAHVVLRQAREFRERSVAPVARDGRFAIATSRTGVFYLQFSGLGHYGTSIPLVIGEPTTVAVDVRLKPYDYRSSFDSVEIIGDFNHFDFGTPRRMTRRGDGSYSFEIETSADSFAYQLIGVTPGQRSINGTQSERYILDNGGDYISVIRSEQGRARVVFNPAALVRRTGEVAITFRDSTSRIARFALEKRAWDRQIRTYLDSSAAWRARRDTSTRFDWSPVVARVSQRLTRARDPLTRQLHLIELENLLMFGARVDTTLVRRIAVDLPPSSIWWSFIDFQSPYNMARVYAMLGGRPLRRPLDSATTRDLSAYAERMVAEHPDRMVQADALQLLLYFSRIGDPQRANDLFLRLITDYPDADGLAAVRAEFAPNRVIHVGAMMPDYHFAGLDDSTVTYTPATFAGHPYLVEFWATWCGPCIGEMPALHAAHDSLASLGVRFFSVSMDQHAEDARTFRTRDWHLPWDNAFAPGVFNNPQTRALEIMFLPRAILVGADGRILAVDGDLRGDQLVPTARRVLAPPAGTR